MRALSRRVFAATALVVGLAAWIGAQQTSVVRAQDQAGAATTAASPQTPEVNALRERAAAFWAARVDADAKAQWELLEPRGRGRLSPADYSSARGVTKYLAYQVEDATVNGHFATVKVRLLAQTTLVSSRGQVKRMPPATSLVMDRWVRVSGVWYRSLEQPEE
jgi:hypothetical protein